MNDEPRRLLEEDPHGAASELLRAALEDGPPPPWEAKQRAAKQLGIGNDAMSIPRWRRIAMWSMSAAVVAAAASAIVMVLPKRSEEPPASEAVTLPAPMAPPLATPMPVVPRPQGFAPFPAAPYAPPNPSAADAGAGYPKTKKNASPPGIVPSATMRPLPADDEFK